MLDAGNRQIALNMHVGHAAKACPGHGRAVIGVPAADKDLALRLALEGPIVPHQTKDRVIGLRA